jgi:hydroxyacylglutathione hydrolase
MIAWETKSGYRVIRILSGRSNVFLIKNREKNILIDTSPAYRWKKLEKALQKNKIDHIDYLILTHSHYDHSENALRIKESFKCPVILHRNEEYNLQTGELSIPRGTNIITRFFVNDLAPKISGQFKSEPCRPDILLESVFDMKVLGFDGYILHTPGHSPGSVSIILEDELAIVGDTMFGIFRWSVFPPFADDVSQLIKSWGLLLETNCVLFLPSHGGAKTRLQLQTDYEKRRLNIPS